MTAEGISRTTVEHLLTVTYISSNSVWSHVLIKTFVQHTGQCINYYVHYLHSSCSAALCPDPAAIVNGMRTFTGISVGDTATYTCDSGFELIGVTTITCTEVDVITVAFSPAPPVCRREYACCLNNLWNGFMLFLSCKSQ